MPRIRTIKPDFWDSSDTAGADLRTRLLFIAMWNWADDYGIGDATPVRVIGFAFPNDEIPVADYPRLLSDVSDHFGVVYFRHEGRPFYAIPSWSKHQRTEKRAKPREGLVEAAERAVDNAKQAGQQGDAEPPTHSDGFSDESVGRPGAGSRKGNGGKGTGEECVPLPDEPPIDDYVPTEIETSTRTTPAKGSSAELTFIRTQVGQRLPAKVEQALVTEIRKLRQYDRPVIEEALRRWANRDGHPGLLPHLVSDVLKNGGRTTEPTKADIWDTSVIQPAQAAATAQRKLS